MSWGLMFFIVTGSCNNIGRFKDITVFWDMTPIIRSKCTRLHGVMSQKTVIFKFTAEMISKLHRNNFSSPIISVHSTEKDGGYK
jgi:hypothetical protein